MILCLPAICRSFQDLLVVQISHKLIIHPAQNCVLYHMKLLGRKGLKNHWVVTFHMCGGTLT